MKKEKENYLDRIPCHTSGYRWTRDEGGLVTIHVVHRGFFARLAQDFFNRPSVSHIDLDAFGSALWLSMDGKKNVGDLAQMMESRFGKQVYPLYERLIVFCRCWSSSNSLRGKNLIGSCFSLRLKARKRHGALLKRRLPALKWKSCSFGKGCRLFFGPSRQQSSCFLIETGYRFFQLNLLCRNDPHGVLKTALLSLAG